MHPSEASADPSSGAKAEIGIGVAVPVLVAIARAISWYWRRRNVATKEPVAPEPTESAQVEKPELHDVSAGQLFSQQEIDSNGLHEMDQGLRDPAELHTHEREGELEGSRTEFGSRNVMSEHGKTRSIRYELA